MKDQPRFAKPRRVAAGGLIAMRIDAWGHEGFDVHPFSANALGRIRDNGGGAEHKGPGITAARSIAPKLAEQYKGRKRKGKEASGKVSHEDLLSG